MVCAPAGGRSVERAVDVYKARVRECTISRVAGKVVEHGFIAGSGDGEYRSGASVRPFNRRTVERAVDVDESGLGVPAVSRAALEAVEHAVRNTRTHSLRRCCAGGWTQRHAGS